jgi:GGDEF domain-containing protein
VPDPSDTIPPTKASRPRRARKFVLPDHHHDEREGERADEHIEAFLATPVPRRRRRHKPTGRVRRPVELDTRADWTAALRHEAARHARYGRPLSVLLIEVDGGPVSHAPLSSAMDRIARVVAGAIRAEARETDRAVRLGVASFRLLLPETGDRAARTVADRLDHAFLASPEANALGAHLTIDIATPTRLGTLEDALADAERRLTARSAEVPG